MWVVTVLYVGIVTTLVCVILRYFRILRVKVESERQGVDLVEFNGLAYDNQILGVQANKTGSGSSRRKKGGSKKVAVETVPLEDTIINTTEDV